MGKIRVAHIITQMELGGAQRNTLYTVTHLNTDRFEPCLLFGPGGILDKEVEDSGVHYFKIPALVRPAFHPIKDFRALVSLYKHLRYIQPDIVHTHSSKAGILGRIAAYLAGVPIIIHTFHGFGFTPQQSALMRRFFVRLEKWCAQLSTHLVFVSEDNREEAVRLNIGPGKPNSLIRSGIQIQSDSSAGSRYQGEEKRKPSREIRQKLKIPDDAWVVTYVGNFKPQKNTKDLVRVAERVLLLAPEVHFLLIGDGEQKDDTRRYIEERHLVDHVHLIGWLKRRDDIDAVLRFSNSFFLTSLWEGLPRALVEAFAARLPAVAYAVNGVRDILKSGETGFAVPPGDIEQAAQQIIWLKRNPDQARAMGARGRQRIEKEFNIDSMVRQQEELYDKLVSGIPLKEYYISHA